MVRVERQHRILSEPTLVVMRDPFEQFVAEGGEGCRVGLRPLGGKLLQTPAGQQAAKSSVFHLRDQQPLRGTVGKAHLPANHRRDSATGSIQLRATDGSCPPRVPRFVPFAFYPQPRCRNTADRRRAGTCQKKSLTEPQSSQRDSAGNSDSARDQRNRTGFSFSPTWRRRNWRTCRSTPA